MIRGGPQVHGFSVRTLLVRSVVVFCLLLPIGIVSSSDITLPSIEISSSLYDAHLKPRLVAWGLLKRAAPGPGALNYGAAQSKFRFDIDLLLSSADEFEALGLANAVDPNVLRAMFIVSQDQEHNERLPFVVLPSGSKYVGTKSVIALEDAARELYKHLSSEGGGLVVGLTQFYKKHSEHARIRGLHQNALEFANRVQLARARLLNIPTHSLKLYEFEESYLEWT